MCPAPDVPLAESGSPSGPESPRSELPPHSQDPLLAVAVAMIETARQTADLVKEIRSLVQSNAQLLAAIAEMNAGEEDELPTQYLSGKPR